jgi:hypothetical protein
MTFKPGRDEYILEFFILDRQPITDVLITIRTYLLNPQQQHSSQAETTDPIIPSYRWTSEPTGGYLPDLVTYLTGITATQPL